MRVTGLLLALPLLVAACEGPPPRPAPTPAPGPRLVLRVSDSSSAVRPEGVPGLPQLAVYDDGRVLLPRYRADSVGSLVPAVGMRTVPPATVTWFADRAREAGLDGTSRDYGTPSVGGDDVTTLFLADAGGTATVSAVALEEGADAGLTAAQASNRRPLYALLRLLRDPASWQGGPFAEATYEPATVGLYARPYGGGGASGPGLAEIAWTGPDPAAGVPAGGWSCTVLAGDALRTALPDLRRGGGLTRWTYGGKAYAFAVRPVLPEETGCAAPSPSPSPSPARVTATPSVAPYAADDVVLRMTTGGGLLPPWTAPAVPDWTLYGDGRVLAVVEPGDVDPQPAWPDIRDYALPRATVERIVAAARDAGLGTARSDFGEPAVTDAQVTVFRFDDGSGAVTTSVYALFGGDSFVRATAEQREARRRLLELGSLLTGDTLRAAPGERDVPYRPALFAIFARPYVRPAGEPAPEALPWTGPDPAKGVMMQPGRCTVLARATLSTVNRKYLMRSSTRTRWDAADGTRWTFGIRPLLPEERTCQDAVRGG